MCPKGEAEEPRRFSDLCSVTLYLPQFISSFLTGNDHVFHPNYSAYNYIFEFCPHVFDKRIRTLVCGREAGQSAQAMLMGFGSDPGAVQQYWSSCLTAVNLFASRLLHSLVQ